MINPRRLRRAVRRALAVRDTIARGRAAAGVDAGPLLDADGTRPYPLGSTVPPPRSVR